MSNPNTIMVQDIYLAKKNISPFVAKTPLVQSPLLEKQVGTSVYFKLEILQKTGSFKIRGATNKIIQLTPDEKARGVVTVSTGNHGKAVSFAAQEIGILATVCMSNKVPKNKVQAIEALGAKVFIHGKSQDEAFSLAQELQLQHGMVLVPPFDDSHIIAGQGTIGLEILEDLPSIGTVIVPLSGGGLISGIALAMKAANPKIYIVGVSMERAPVMYHCLKAGKPIQMDEEKTLADSLQGGIGLENQFTFEIVRDLVDEVILVSEEEIASAMRLAFWEHHLVLEGAGAVGIAALSDRKIQNTHGDVVVVLSGGNVDIAPFLELILKDNFH